MSSDSETGLSELPREELEDRVRQLEEDVAKLKADKADSADVVSRIQFNHFINRLTTCEIDDFTADPMPHLGAVEDFGDRLRSAETVLHRHESIIQDRHTPQGTGPEEHWWSVVEYAHNVSDQAKNSLPGSWVALFKDDVAAATGVSERRAGQLMDQWGGKEEGHQQKNGTRFQPYQRASAGSNHEATRKAIKIDLDMWEDPR